MQKKQKHLPNNKYILLVISSSSLVNFINPNISERDLKKPFLDKLSEYI